MLLNRRTKSTMSDVSTGVLLGVGVCLLLTLLGSIVLTWMIHAEALQSVAVGYGVICVLLLSSLVGTWIASVKVNRFRAQVCLITAVGYYVVLLAMTALFFGGRYQGMGVTAVVVILGCIIAILIGLKSQKGKKMKIRKTAYC